MIKQTSIRNYSFDVLRVFAIFAVVMIHVSAGYVTGYPNESSEFMFGNFFDGVSRCGVPLFVMLSGALMLDEKRTFSLKDMKRHVIQLLVLLYVWSFIYACVFYLLPALIRQEAIPVRSFVRAVLFGHYHLWYMYMLIGLYLITPVLKAFVNEKNKVLVEWFLLLSVIFQFTAPLIEFFASRFTGMTGYVQNFADHWRVGFVTQYTAYYLLGWYLCHIPISRKVRTRVYSLGVLAAGFTVLATQAFLSEDKKTGMFYENLELNVLLYSAAVFTFLYYHLKEKTPSPRVCDMAKKVSGMTFGVYVIHAGILAALVKMIRLSCAPVNILLLWLVTTVLSFFITWIISCLPGIRKLVKL